MSISTRIVIDGLWKCLCPSIDTAFLAKAIEFRPTLPLLLSSSNTPATDALARRRNTTNHSFGGGNYSRQQQIRSKRKGHTVSQYASFYKIDPNAEHTAWSAEKIVENHTVDFHALNATPVENVLEAIAMIMNVADQATKIRMLVFYAVKRGVRPNSFLYEALVSANCDPQRGIGDELHNIWIEMAVLEIAPSASFYHTMLKALAIHPDYLMRNVILSRMKVEGVELTVEGKSHVALGMLRENQVEMALDYLEEGMVREGIMIPYWVVEIFVFVLGRRGFLDEAFQLLLSQLGNVDTGIDRVSLNLWHFVLEECSREMHYEGTKTAWDEIVKPGILNPSDGLTSNVLNTAARYGDSVMCMEAIEKLSAKGVKLTAVHYEALLEAYAKQGELAKAFEVLCIMEESGIEAEQASTRPIWKLLMGEPELAAGCMEILTDLDERRMKIPSVALFVLLEFAVCRGGMELAMDVYAEVRRFSAPGQDGLYLGFLFTQANTSAEGKYLLEQMNKYHVEETTSTLDEMVRLSAIDGSLDDAFRRLWEISKEIKSSQSAYYPSNKTLVILQERLFRDLDPRVYSVLQEIDRRRPAMIRGLNDHEEFLLYKIRKPEHPLPLLVLGSPDPEEKQRELEKVIAAKEAEAARKAEEEKNWRAFKDNIVTDVTWEDEAEF
ncbi:hypothetical protein QBC38DRAFT_466666 [Podospora fimiseda]|uniref:Pentatricopeptide repeat-containing protein-mitochondrial domain-containing protein n=1 Tax=Podospora fimiseda TaxID=252190 RepID=A0AAN7H3S5_9PEZI|nr:hypothetical protein QBC38DRAFT_466666 [Podospora fimiseda]